MRRLVQLRLALTGCVAAALLVSPLNAQDSVLRVEYVEIHVDAAGNDSVVGAGTHYIHGDGRHRHDLVRRGAEISYYRLPDDELVVSVNHALRIAIRTRSFPWNPSTKMRFGAGSGKVALNKLDRDLGQRAHGPMLLQGVADDTMELWVYHHPLLATNPLRYAPVIIESTRTSPETGSRRMTRVTSAERIPMADGVFYVPYGQAGGRESLSVRRR